MSTNAPGPILDPFKLAGQLSGKLLLDGALTPALSGKTFPVINPATGKTIAEAAQGEQADVDAAVDSAAKAQIGWANLPAPQPPKAVPPCRRPLNQHLNDPG